MASNLSKKVAKGDVGAYKELYNNTRATVWYINYLLLCDKNAANESTKAVYKNAFFEIADAPENADRFAEFVEEKAVTYCKIKLAKSNNKEFRIPDSKNFSSFVCDEKSVITDEKLELSVLKNMPALHRFIYVMSVYLKWTDARIAMFFHTSEETVRLAHEADALNVAKIALALSLASGKTVSLSKEELTSLIECVEGSFDIDEETDRQILLSIYDTVAPIKEKRAKQTNKNLMIGAIVSVAVLIVAVIACAVILNANNLSETDSGKQEEFVPTLENREKREYTVPYNVPEEITHYATIDIKYYGQIKLALCGNIAPKTVENFEKLANEKFYDGLTLHRIIEGFMMQGGCPKGDGTGGYEDENGNEVNIKGEFESNGHQNDIGHKRGVISMARNGYSNDSASSQFFIVQETSSHLDGDYAAFGYVVEGMHVVDFICEDAVPTDNNGSIAKNRQPIINSIRVEKV